MEVHQHVLLERGLAVVDADRVVVSVQAVNQRLDRGLIQVTQVRCALAGLLAEHQRLRVNQPECIDHDFALDGLDGIDDDGDGSWGKLLEALLGVDVDAGQPAAETRVRVVPSNDGFGPMWRIVISIPAPEHGKDVTKLRCLPSCLSQHLHHLHLEHRVDGLDTDAGTTLWHGKHVHDTDSEIVDELSQHQSHDFHWYTCPAMSQHLEEGEGGNVDGLGVIDQGGVVLAEEAVCQQPNHERDRMEGDLKGSLGRHTDPG